MWDDSIAPSGTNGWSQDLRIHSTCAENRYAMAVGLQCGKTEYHRRNNTLSEVRNGRLDTISEPAAAKSGTSTAVKLNQL